MKLTTLSALLCLAACSAPRERPEPGQAAPPAQRSPHAEADLLFQQRCTPCHGSTGAGDGAASAALNPKPPSFHDPDWQKSIPDDYIDKIVAYGGRGFGRQ